MGVLKVETFDVNVSSNGQTHTLTNTVVLNNAFVRINNWRDMSGGPTGSTGNEGPDALSVLAKLNSTTQIVFNITKGSTSQQKVIGEVWRYTGSSGGPDEFIVRGRYTMALGANVENTSTAVSGISDRNKCVCFINGKDTGQNSNTLWQQAGAIAYIDSSDNLVVSRQDDNGAAIDVQVTVVEFTGANWTVGYYRGGFSTGQKTLVNDSQGTGGSTFSVPSWSKAMIVQNQQEGDSGSNTAIEDRSHAAAAGSDVTKVSVEIDSTSANNGDIFIYVLCHPAMSTARTTASKSIPNNGSYDTSLTVPQTLADVTEGALEWTGFSEGGGTAHARGALSAYMSSASQISTWVHRSGNTGTYWYGVADFGNINGTAYIKIDSVDGDNIVSNSQTNVIIIGQDFESSQGSGKVELVENDDYTGTKVTQSVDSWSDTQIQIDIVAGALADSFCFLFVTNDSSDVGFIAVQVGIPPESYSDVVINLTGGTPDHWWKLQNDFDDDGYSADNRPMTQSVVGTHEFDTSPELVRGETYALRFDSNTDSRRISDVDDMNSQTQTARSFGTWICFNTIQKSLNCFYNEGGSVNNLAFIMGVGNKLLAQFADTGDDNVHVYSDFALDINRPYFIVFAFDYGGDQEFKFWIDAIKQSADNGNPLTSTNLDAHVGDVVFGKPETNLEVFGTDITFDGNEYMWSAHWFSFTRELSQAELTELFEKGAPAKYTIESDTEANMQSDIDALADTEIENYPIGILFDKCTAGDFEIEFDNITFDSRCTCEIAYHGTGILTIVKTNGTEIDTDKISTPYGGTVNIVESLPVKLTALNATTQATIQGARVLMLADSGGDLPYEDSVSITRSGSTATVSHSSHGLQTGQKVLIAGANQREYNGVQTITVTTADAYTFTVSGTPATPATGTIVSTCAIISDVTDVNGEVSVNLRYSSDQPVSARSRKSSSSPFYQPGTFTGTINNTGLDATIYMIPDE